MEIDTFSMPVTDDLVDSKTGEQVSKQDRINSGVLIKIIKQ